MFQSGWDKPVAGNARSRGRVEGVEDPLRLLVVADPDEGPGAVRILFPGVDVLVLSFWGVRRDDEMPPAGGHPPVVGGDGSGMCWP